MNESPLISIVTVTYNAEKTLERTIKSVINQTYKNIEYIIIDGKSSDGTLDIIKKYEKYVSFWVSEKDSGIYNAMNKGISHAHGDYVALLNADDWYDDDTLELIIESINHQKADVYYGLLRYINPKTHKCEMIFGRTIEQINIDMIAHPTCFISKKIYENHSYNEEYKYSADYDFILTLVEKRFSFCFIEKILANFSMDGASASVKAQFETINIRKNHGLISEKEAKHQIFGLKKHIFKQKIHKIF